MKTARTWVDPFDKMSDEEFDAHVDDLFAARPATVAVSLRMAPDLLRRLKRQASRAGVRYQTFMKGILEAVCLVWNARALDGAGGRVRVKEHRAKRRRRGGRGDTR